MLAKSSIPATVLILNFRYSPRAGWPRSMTTMEATVWLPWKWEMSKPSMRWGAAGSPSIPFSSSKAPPRRGGALPILGDPLAEAPGLQAFVLQHLPGVGLAEAHQGHFFAALRYEQVHPGPALRRQPGGHGFHVLNGVAQEHFLGHGRGARIELLHKGAQGLRRVGGFGVGQSAIL